MTEGFEKPVGGEAWFSELEAEFVADQRERMIEEFGEEAVEAVMEMTRLFADLIYIDRENVRRIKAGLSEMANVVNDMLPRINGRTGMTRVYDDRDLHGTLDPLPVGVQRVFVAIVGTVLLHSKGGPHDSAVNIAESVDRLANLVRSEGRGL